MEIFFLVFFPVHSREEGKSDSKLSPIPRIEHRDVGDIKKLPRVQSETENHRIEFRSGRSMKCISLKRLNPSNE